MDNTRNGHSMSLLAAVGAGALLMYLLDPQQGRRRLAIARDKAVHLATKTSDFVDAGLQDASHRATGWAAQLRGAARRGPPSDDVLAERVRARLGRLVSHPGALRVAASAGTVSLSGPVLAGEEKHLLYGVYAVAGVRRVENQLELHASSDGIPGLQGGSERPARTMRRNWPAGTRLLAVLAGTAIAGYGLQRRGPAGALLGSLGMGLVARSITNRPIGEAGQAVDELLGPEPTPEMHTDLSSVDTGIATRDAAQVH